MKTNENLGQDRLMLFPASKTAPPLQIPGYAPATIFKIVTQHHSTLNVLNDLHPDCFNISLS